jgi:hypothetical protein
MKQNYSFPKSLVVSLLLIISFVVINKAEATYIVEWQDYGQEWYFLPGDTYPTTRKANSWVGYFTLPDSAVTYYPPANGSPKTVGIHPAECLDFSLSGQLPNGNYIEATAFHGGDLMLGVPIEPDSKYDYFWGGSLSFVMADPSWLETPLYINQYDQDSWLYYKDTVFDAYTSNMVSVYISHYGRFVGHYVDEAAPVPEPATMFLFGAGLVGLVGTKLRKKKNI